MFQFAEKTDQKKLYILLFMVLQYGINSVNCHKEYITTYIFEEVLA